MDLLGYAALGGLERLTIIAGAVIIGYWGYRLYTAEKSAGLVFMGLAVIVLVGALATGGSWVRSVGEGYQLASLPAEAPAAEAAPAPKAKSPFVEPVEVAETPLPAPVESATESPAAPVDVDLAESAPEPAEDVPAPAAEPDAVASPVRLATGQELGGRIVSVKSENVSLEWSSDSD